MLRARVFKPVEDARAIRLNAKLQELIAQPLPEREEMDLDTGALKCSQCVALTILTLM